MKNALAATLLGLGFAACASAPGQPDESLTNRYWRVVEIDGQAVVVGINRSEPHVVFADGGKTHGSDGCNRFDGSYEEAGGLRFGRLASTRMACLPPIGDQARLFFKATGATAGYRIRGKTLELLDASGKPLMRLEFTPLK